MGNGLRHLPPLGLRATPSLGIRLGRRTHPRRHRPADRGLATTRCIASPAHVNDFCFTAQPPRCGGGRARPTYRRLPARAAYMWWQAVPLSHALGRRDAVNLDEHEQGPRERSAEAGEGARKPTPLRHATSPTGNPRGPLPRREQLSRSAAELLEAKEPRASTASAGAPGLSPHRCPRRGRGRCRGRRRAVVVGVEAVLRRRVAGRRVAPGSIGSRALARRPVGCRGCGCGEVAVEHDVSPFVRFAAAQRSSMSVPGAKPDLIVGTGLNQEVSPPAAPWQPVLLRLWTP